MVSREDKKDFLYFFFYVARDAICDCSQIVDGFKLLIVSGERWTKDFREEETGICNYWRSLLLRTKQTCACSNHHHPRHHHFIMATAVLGLIKVLVQIESVWGCTANCSPAAISSGKDINPLGRPYFAKRRVYLGVARIAYEPPPL